MTYASSEQSAFLPKAKSLDDLYGHPARLFDLFPSLNRPLRRQLASLIAGGRRCSNGPANVDGLDYGLPGFVQRKFFSKHFSIRLSDFLIRTSAALGRRKLSHWFAEVSFYVFQHT